MAACAVLWPHIGDAVGVPASLLTAPFLGVDTHPCVQTLRQACAPAWVPGWTAGGNGVRGHILVGCCAL